MRQAPLPMRGTGATRTPRDVQRAIESLRRFVLDLERRVNALEAENADLRSRLPAQAGDGAEQPPTTTP